MNAQELRQKYISFFISKLHHHYASGSLVPYDITGKLDESLLFNGAGMVPFKPYFRGTATPSSLRLVNSQKCVRTGDIEEVGDSSHLTFFEMLGNFSFGDYFKKEAIQWAWEFLTSSDWLSINPAYLCTTVFEEDQEAYMLWSEIWEKAGFEPENKIFKLDETTNYWPAGAYSAGPPGPCGPNSEIFYWTHNEPASLKKYTVQDYLKDDQDKKWLEIWNLVFIQYEWQGDPQPDKSYKKTGMLSLPFKSIDTGMGLERVACALGNHKTVYDTDVFTPIIRKLESLLPDICYGQNIKSDQAIRIIVDHLRTACFCIADGIFPSNTGRGYVLRRLIRRAVLKGQHVLGLKKSFLHEVALGVEEAMGEYYSELKERTELIQNTLINEESLFRNTLASGTDILRKYLEELSVGDQLSGKKAFMLYDTFGFPFEVTQELCLEMGFKVDETGYQESMLEAQILSRGALAMETVYGDQEEIKNYTTDNDLPTKFIGYETLESQSQIVKVRYQADKVEVALDSTPFYAESGGQIGDTGTLKAKDLELKVVNTRKIEGIFWHQVESLPISPEKLLKCDVLAIVESPRRQAVMIHHTGTHLLHAALRKILGTHVTQAGSLVTSNSLRFDFTHGKSLTKEELNQVESLVNQRILKNDTVDTHADISIEEAKSKGAMALFGEKYGKFVRMIQIKEFSKELCGGTHIKHTGEIGLFKIISESSVSSGIRRIEAIGGKVAYDWINSQIETLSKAATLLKSTPNRILDSIEKIQNQNKELDKKIEKSLSLKNIAEDIQSYHLGSITLITHFLENAEVREATSVADQLVAQHLNRVVIVGWRSEDKGGFVCKVGLDALKEGYHAGNTVRLIAQMTGGNGGGKAEFATAGAKEIDKIVSSLQEIHKIITKSNK